MSPMKEIQASFGERLITMPLSDVSEVEDLSNAPTNKLMCRILESMMLEVNADLLRRSRKGGVRSDSDVKVLSGYIQALEDVCMFLREDLKEGLKEDG